MSRFIQISRQQQFLLPPSIDEWLPERHLARFVVEVIEQLDLSRLTSRYAGRGSAAYHPATLLAILVYGYSTGVFSSRKLELATYDSVAFRFLSGGTHPDHDTLANFRKTFLVELEGLFVQILQLAQAMKLLKLGQIALDGTKIKANASKHKALSHGHIEKQETQLKEEVRMLLKKAEQADHSTETQSQDLPAELARREERLKALAEAKAKITARVNAADAQEQQAYQDKINQREALRQQGKKPRGKEPSPPKTGPKDSDQVNLTDEESRIMPTKQGFIQGYNSQAAVDTDTMLIVATDVSQSTNDKQQLSPILAELDKLPESLGKAGSILADTGYFSTNNVRRCVAQGIEPLIAAGRERHHLGLAERLAPDTAPPDTEDVVDKMLWYLKTKAGRARYSIRKSTVEPVFGIIKQVLGFRQFSLRGLEAVKGEWKLAAIAFNLKRMHVLLRK